MVVTRNEWGDSTPGKPAPQSLARHGADTITARTRFFAAQ